MYDFDESMIQEYRQFANSGYFVIRYFNRNILVSFDANEKTVSAEMPAGFLVHDWECFLFSLSDWWFNP